MRDIKNDIDASLSPKTELVIQPETVEFTNSLPQTFAEAVRLLYSNHIYADDNVLQNRIRLAQFSRKFHSDADTLTDNIENQWDLLNDPATKLPCFHSSAQSIRIWRHLLRKL